jgi:sulfite reductase beta subunit-like hemoprotein
MPALAYFLLGHKDTQDFGRKFNGLSGCAQRACGLVNMHDLGLIAVPAAAPIRRGFQFYVGGGLGAVPHKLAVAEFVSEDELLPLARGFGCLLLWREEGAGWARLKF